MNRLAMDCLLKRAAQYILIAVCSRKVFNFLYDARIANMGIYKTHYSIDIKSLQ